MTFFPPGVAFVPPDAGPRVWVGDERLTFVVGGEQTGGAYAVTDSTVPPGGSAPPHLHRREDESFWVLDGVIEVTVDDRSREAPAGTFVHLPRGLVHTFRNIGEGPARFLTLLTPAGLEGFFAEVGVPVVDPDVPPPFTEVELERLLQAAPRYGVEIPLD